MNYEIQQKREGGGWIIIYIENYLSWRPQKTPDSDLIEFTLTR